MLLAKVKELESENIAFSEQIHKQSAVLKQLRKDTQSTM